MTVIQPQDTHPDFFSLSLRKQFNLVVNDFGTNCIGKKTSDHLINTLKQTTT